MRRTLLLSTMVLTLLLASGAAALAVNRWKRQADQLSR
jgi:hypothetical protein